MPARQAAGDARLPDVRGYGVIHIDVHFERLARHAGLSFPTRHLTLPDPPDIDPAARRRALHKQLKQELHNVSFVEAEACLVDAIARAENRRQQS